ncbi:MAG: hypothetical protein V3T70_05795 [Phycisphaerae bacterium]
MRIIMSARNARSASRAAVSAIVTALAGGACSAAGTDASHVEFVFGDNGMGRGEFAYPRGLTVSPVDGCVFIVDKAARVQRFDPQGRYETEWRMPEYDAGKPTGLAVDRRNRVWIADTHYSRVIVYDRDGRELFRFGESGDGPGQFRWPTTVAFDADGNAYVGEYGGNDRISRFTADGEFAFSFASGDAQTGGTNRPQGLAFDADGVLWVADAANHRIGRYARDGEFLGAFGNMGAGHGEFRYPYDVAVDAEQTIWISDYGNNRVVRMHRTGDILASWGSLGREPGQLRHAWSLDVAPNGLLYVLDSWNSRVQVLAW